MENSQVMEKLVRQRIAELHEDVPGTIGDLMNFQLLSCNAEAGEYHFRCSTAEWMRNFQGTLHGGLCATVVDQAMGIVAYCIKPGEGNSPTVQMQVLYHRPLIPGERVLVNVRVVSRSRSLMSLAAEAYLESAPEKLCLSANGTYFYKPATP